MNHSGHVDFPSEVYFGRGWLMNSNMIDVAYALSGLYLSMTHYCSHLE
jgi:hypothetical protein